MGLQGQRQVSRGTGVYVGVFVCELNQIEREMDQKKQEKSEKSENKNKKKPKKQKNTHIP
jgi:hypothetical protein